MNVRTAAGIVLGIAVWWVLFMASTFLIVVAWPTSEAFRQAVFDAGDYSVFPTAMLLAFLAMYVPIGLIAGRAAVSITRVARHAWIVAAPILLFALFQHLYVLWNNLPNWYNVAVVLLIAPFIVVGGRSVKPSGSPILRSRS